MRSKAFLHIAAYSITGMVGMTLISSCGTSSPDKISVPAGTPAHEVSAVANSALAKAKGYEKAGDTRKALSSYSRIIKVCSHTNAAAEATYSKAKILDDQGETFDSFETYQQLITNHPSSKHYSTAVKRQEQMAYAVADGVIQNKFLGIKSNISTNKIVSMLGDIRDNAPSAPSASRAQYKIGQVHQKDTSYDAAAAAYKKLALNYPNSKEAPEALYQTGEMLVEQSEKGNQNKANVNSARNIYSGLIDRYPSHPRAKDARARGAALSKQNITRNYETAEFYRKKNKNTSAIFYYNEVIRQSPSGSLHDLAKHRIAELQP